MSKKSDKTKRRRERCTRKNLEFNNAKSMIDKPATHPEAAKPEKKKPELPSTANAMLGNIPTPTRQPQEKDAPKKRAIWRRIPGLWGWVKRRFRFLDEHHGSVTAIATIVIGILTYWYVQYSKKQWQVAQETLTISQRAYVTIGRKDGVVADFIVPKDPTQNTEIVIFFQNSGHLPAKVAWGTGVSYSAQDSTKKSGITLTHPFQGLSYRTRDIKTGSIGTRGGSSIVAGESILVSTLGVISQKDFEELPTNPGLLILGTFEYCDELGNHSMHMFGLRYRNNSPSSSLRFELAQDMSIPVAPLPQNTSTTEYLPPCETFSERKQTKTKTTQP